MMSRFTPSGQQGGILVLFAIFAPLLVIFLIYVIDVDNWLEHKRYLQVRADAAALATAADFISCNNGTIYSRAGQYAGVATVTTPSGGTVASTTPLTNTEINTTGSLHAQINSQTFYGQSSTNSPPTPDTTVRADPCSTDAVDVKLTETNLPWYFQLLSSVPYINAEAQLSVLQVSSGTGSLPVAVNDNNPLAAEAYFVNSSGQQIGSGVALCPVGTNPTTGYAVWDNAGTSQCTNTNPPTTGPASLSVNTAASGVRVAISGRNNLTGTMSTDCSASSPVPFVQCYDLSGSELVHIQGYGNSAGTTANPAAGQVTLSGAPGTGGCTDGYFSNPSGASCTIGVSANVDFGTAAPPAGAEVDAVVGSVCYGLTYQSTSQGTTKELWSSQSSAPSTSCTGFNGNKKAGTGYAVLTAGAGSTPVNLQIVDGSGKSAVTKTCSNTAALCDVQSSYTAGTNSGPIQLVSLAQVGGASFDADSFPTGSTPSLVLTVDLTGSIQDAQSTSDKLFTMRFDGTGSQNQSVSCPAINGGSTYTDMLASGCAGQYAINISDTACANTSPQPGPADCVTPATGNKQNDVANAMNQRVLGSSQAASCTNPNHWGSFTFTNGIPNASPTDPRLITIFLTPFGSFGGNGSSSAFPILDFATFYITGWQGNGNGFSDPCPVWTGSGPPADGYNDPAAGGTVVGHFIKYIDMIGTQTGSGSCQLSSLDECVAVLSK